MTTITVHAPAGQFVTALVDADVAAEFGEFTWRLHNGYASRELPRSLGRHRLYLHREILGLTRGDGLYGDHIDGNTLDNRRCNLRIVNPSQSAQNVSGRENTASRFRGVARSFNGRRWRAFAQLNGRYIALGVFDEEEEAAAVSAAWRAEHMPFSRDANAAPIGGRA